MAFTSSISISLRVVGWAKARGTAPVEQKDYRAFAHAVVTRRNGGQRGQRREMHVASSRTRATRLCPPYVHRSPPQINLDHPLILRDLIDRALRDDRTLVQHCHLD